MPFCWISHQLASSPRLPNITCGCDATVSRMEVSATWLYVLTNWLLICVYVTSCYITIRDTFSLSL